MTAFLETCQKVARESGAAPDTLPTAVTSQPVRLLKIINWVANVWNEIDSPARARLTR